jgi:hypothetical protein
MLTCSAEHRGQALYLQLMFRVRHIHRPDDGGSTHLEGCNLFNDASSVTRLYTLRR